MLEEEQRPVIDSGEAGAKAGVVAEFGVLFVDRCTLIATNCDCHASPPFVPSGLSAEEALCLTWKMPLGS